MREAGFRQRWSERSRTLQIYDTFLRYGADMALSGTLVGPFRRRMQSWAYGTEVHALPAPEAVRLMLQELGPTYVKVGQIVSSQARILPPDWEEALEKLQSEVKPFSAEQAREVIEENLGAPPEELYETWDPRPLAAASLAQVHRATLKDGREVAIKVRRPNIDEQLQADLLVMRRMSAVAERRLSWAREIGLVGVVDNFGQSLMRELDYTIEAYNARRLARNLASIEGIHIPEVIRPLSGHHVLTLEFINGVKATERDAIVAAGLDPVKIGDAAVRAAIKMLLIDGFFHADPHPGNVLVSLDTGVLTFIDTGMVGELDLKQRFHLVNLILAFNGDDLNALAQALRSVSTPYRETDDHAFYRDFERTMAPLKDVEPGQPVPFARMMNAAMDSLRDNGFRLDASLTLAIKALTQAEAFTRTLYPPGSSSSFGPKATEITRELLAENVTTDAIVEFAKRQGTQAVRQAASSVDVEEIASTWFNVFKSGRFTVKLDTSDVDRQIDRLADIARLVTIGIILAGVLVGAGVAATVSEASGTLGTLRQVALWGFAAGMVLAAVLVVVLLRQIARGNRERARKRRR